VALAGERGRAAHVDISSRVAPDSQPDLWAIRRSLVGGPPVYDLIGRQEKRHRMAAISSGRSGSEPQLQHFLRPAGNQWVSSGQDGQILRINRNGKVRGE
jgi:hypothetical protein